MMTQAFYTGISGIRNYSEGINVVSNNLANISTTGFRGNNAEFASLFEKNLAANAATGVVDTGFSDGVGTGTRIQAISMTERQGTLALSDRSTDLAILGDGWFGIQGDGNPLYTRDGSFNIDANSNLITADGLYVLGTSAGNISEQNELIESLPELQLGNISSVEKLSFPQTLIYPPEPTTVASYYGNLGAGFDPVVMNANIIDPENHHNSLRLEFVKKEQQTPPGSQYDVTATVQSNDGSIIYSTQTGEVDFSENGTMLSSTLTTIDNNGALVTIDLGSGFSGITAIDNTEISSSSSADGTLGGELSGYSISQNAEVIATFSNGKQSSVAKIAVFHFQNDQGLGRVTGTRFQESSNSGKAFFYQDAEGNNINGTAVQNYRLEGSNVEMSESLTQLIVYQRAFDANSKSVTTADQMMQKALNMDA